jgi:curved DNA-binding protein CbpA
MERATPAAYPFSALGLGIDASVEDVRRAFRQRAYAAHPDRGGSMAAFVALEAAYRSALELASRAA